MHTMRFASAVKHFFKPDHICNYTKTVVYDLQNMWVSFFISWNFSSYVIIILAVTYHLMFSVTAESERILRDEFPMLSLPAPGLPSVDVIDDRREAMKAKKH